MTAIINIYKPTAELRANDADKEETGQLELKSVREGEQTNGNLSAIIFDYADNYRKGRYY